VIISFGKFINPGELLPIMPSTGRPGRGPSVRIQVNKRVGISPVEKYERAGKFVI